MSPEEALRAAGFEPDFNVCAACLHHGSQHDLANICLICGDRFASMTDDEQMAHALAALPEGSALVTTETLAAALDDEKVYDLRLRFYETTDTDLAAAIIEALRG